MNRPGNERSLLRLLWIIFVDQAAITITFPLLTLIFFDSHSRLFAADTSYATRSMWYGFCVALPNIINMFFAPLLSTLSDQWGRKKILLLEIFSATFFTLTVGLGIYLGLLGLVFTGFIIKGAFVRTNPTALAIIGETSPQEKKVLSMGYLQFAISVGAFVGPLIGGYLANRFLFDTFNFSVAFFIAALLTLANGISAFLLIHETLQKNPHHKPLSWNAIKTVILHPHVLRISLILLLIQLSWSTYYQFMPPLLKTFYQFDSQQLGWFIGSIAFWLALATGILLKILHRYFTMRQLLMFSVYAILSGLLLKLLCCAGYLPSGALIWLAAMPVATGDVIAYSCLTALYSDAVRDEQQGKVMGVGFIVVSFVWATTGFLGGLLGGISPLLPLLLAPLGVIFSLWMLHGPFGGKLVSFEPILQK